MKRSFFLSIIVLFCTAIICRAETPQGEADHANGLYEVGEPIVFRFTGLAKNTEFPVSLLGDKTVNKTVKMKSDAQGNLKVETKLGRPGAVRCEVIYEPRKKVVAGAASHLEKIRGARPMPADFVAFWKQQTTVLDQTPLKPELKPVRQQGAFEVSDLTLPCPGSKTAVRGYFVTKKNAAPKSCPAILTLHGAGVRSAGITFRWVNSGFISLDINAHGIENGKPKEFYSDLFKNELKRYNVRGFMDRKDNYFLGMFLRVYRALQYLKSRPEWDGKTLVVWGSSQGGYQAFVGGGLDPQVTAVVAFVAAGCDHGGHLAGREAGWPQFYKQPDYRKNPDKAAQEVDYYDAVNFARQITKADLFVSVGLIDNTCPAASVCAAYNEAPTSGKKMLVVDPKIGHQVSKEASDKAAEFLQKHKVRK